MTEEWRRRVQSSSESVCRLTLEAVRQHRRCLRQRQPTAMRVDMWCSLLEAVYQNSIRGHMAMCFVPQQGYIVAVLVNVARASTSSSRSLRASRAGAQLAGGVRRHVWWPMPQEDCGVDGRMRCRSRCRRAAAQCRKSQCCCEGDDLFTNAHIPERRVVCDMLQEGGKVDGTRLLRNVFLLILFMRMGSWLKGAKSLHMKRRTKDDSTWTSYQSSALQKMEVGAPMITA